MDIQAIQRLSIPVSERDHIRGRFDSPLTLLEYGDYECDYCGRAYGVVAAVREHFGPRLRFVFRNFPHSSIHPRASMAAQAAETAAAQGKFWEMHDLLYKHQTELAAADLTHYALRVGLELYHFHSDMGAETYADRVAADHQGGVESGVRRTPTFFVNDLLYDGPIEFEPLVAAIEAAAARA